MKKLVIALSIALFFPLSMQFNAGQPSLQMNEAHAFYSPSEITDYCFKKGQSVFSGQCSDPSIQLVAGYCIILDVHSPLYMHAVSCNTLQG